MAKWKANALDNLAQGFADAGRVSVVNKAMVGFEPVNSVLAPTAKDYLLMSLLGVDHDWVVFFDAVFSGRLHGAMLCGAEEHPAVILAQAMMFQRYGFIKHPLLGGHVPIHPITKAKIDYNINKHYNE